MMQSNIVGGSLENIEAISPFGRIGRPDDVAEGIVAIMTTGWITGQAAIADGGIGLTTPRGAWRMEHVFGVTPAETP